MMNKIRSARLHLLRFLFLLPLLSVILLAFRTRYPQFLHGNKERVVNAVGIAIGLPAKTPLAGVVVRDKNTGLQATTDAHGYFKLRIPISADSIRVHLDFSKDGYQSTFTERFWPSIKETSGLIDIAGLTTLAPHEQEFFMAAPNFHSLPADPAFSDATAELERVLTENRQFIHMQSVQTKHPEISLFYVTEDKKNRLVVHTDGSVERYGYPGTPDLAEMDKKYGPLPAYMTRNEIPVNKGYLDRWATISAQAEKEFHPTGGNPKAILFPGDSRVLVVDANGKTRIYDMDNTSDPKERPAFEKTYGKLPPCVPEKGGVATVVWQTSQNQARYDTVPGKTDSARLPIRASRINGAGRIPPATLRFSPRSEGDPVFFIDGKRLPDNVEVGTVLPPDSIASIQIVRAGPSAGQYGPDVLTRGAVFITTLSGGSLSTPSTMPTMKFLYQHPLVIVDGIVAPRGDSTFYSLNPSNIESMKVLKDSAATAPYGDRGRNGVILVTLKKELHLKTDLDLQKLQKQP